MCENLKERLSGLTQKAYSFLALYKLFLHELIIKSDNAY